MTNFKSVIINIDGREGIFHTNKSLNIFWEHETESSVKETLTAVMKEIKKMMKNASEVTVDILELDKNMKRYDKYRIIAYITNWTGTYRLDIRPFNGRDYSDVHEYTFVDEKSMYKYLHKTITNSTDNILGYLPEDETYYHQKMHGTAPENVMEELNSRW